MNNMQSPLKLVELIEKAPWREAITFRKTFPHEYVYLIKNKQAELYLEICKRMCDGEAIEGQFFRNKMIYLFIGEYKYWFMVPCHQIPIMNPDQDYVLNRCPLTRTRYDFIIDGKKEVVMTEKQRKEYYNKVDYTE